MFDVHEELAFLSKELQRQSIVFSEIEALLVDALGKLEFLKQTDGVYLKEIKATIEVKTNEDGSKYANLNGEKLLTYKDCVGQEFAKLEETYITCLQKNIRQRFRKEDTEIFKDLSLVLDPAIVNSSQQSECEDAVKALGMFYGENKEVTIIHGNLETDLEEEKQEVSKLLDSNKLLEEWPRLKGMINGCYKNVTAQVLCQRIIQLHSGKGLSECSKLCKIGLCLAVTSVECERCCSTQNRLKSKFRSSLKDENLDLLITFNMSEISVASYDPRKAVQLWATLKKRRKWRLQESYKPRAKEAKKV